jgi:hypothetical protein
MCYVQCRFYENRALDEIMCGKCGRDTDSNLIRRMGVTFWITKVTNTQSE